jgi:hypothetical protein
MMNAYLSNSSDFLSKKWKFLLKWGVVIAAYVFLAHKLIHFTHYDQLFFWWQQLPALQFCWLVAVVVLLPLNWFLEALKWNFLTAHIQKTSLKTSLEAVLAGVSTGFFTPNRVGELVGRVLYLDTGNRKAGIALSVVNSLTQNLVMAIFGIPACLILFYSTKNAFVLDMECFLWIALLFLALSLALYFSLPKVIRYVAQTAIAKRISDFTVGVSMHSRNDLFRIIGVSMLRYFVFCLQFFLMLRFFGIHLQVYEALIAIPTNYLLVTFLPSLAFSEVAVRSSSAVLVIGLFSGQVVNIALAGICIWAINFIVPMLIGSAMMIRRKV